ncbi:linear amide C-N hydrolase [Elizabethkingia sp. HX WHF]|uniref:linear amide C-N hydrolase n=1 Tax=Elizabethkingia TaxID=308865 RepID=UPI001C86BD22|nr:MULTISPECIES: linear amide C-N hydrolase [Elizabethkingia]MCL1639471.1 linear amide C-N hydrolase [Elizabethkingia bruuniana]MDX8565025.1 linear amide C-N hydrolase [Elizabethkingia sp. HX WHF]
MKINKLIPDLFLMLFLFQFKISLACTIFIASDKQKVLVGNNEDYNPALKNYLWVRPAVEKQNAYVLWGFEEQYPEGGMNDKGLFFDAAALPQKVELVKDSQKKDFEGYIVDKVLQECSTVNEVIELVSKYNLTWYEKTQVFVADKSGDYAIINANYIIRPNNNKYVLTNYNLNDPINKDFKCWRRKTAYQLLNSEPISVAQFSKILDSTSQLETDNATIYSQVCDLKNNTIYLYQRHNFTQVNKIDLISLLQKGKQEIEIKNLFPKKITNEIMSTYLQNGIHKTIEYVKKRKSDKSYLFSEKDLIQIGYQLIDSSKVSDAEKIFALNLKYFPNSESTLTALANSLLLSGNTKKANALYGKVRKINPNNYYVNIFGKNNGNVTFRIKGFQGAETISLTGSFNNYDIKANPFTKVGNDWICSLKVPPGVYSYKLNIDNTYWVQDPSNQIHIKPKEWWDSRLIVQ